MEKGNERLEQFNLFLLIVAFGLAVFLPIQTLVLAYSILGPLHYLTEIAWLERRQFFLPGPRDYYALVILAILSSALAVSLPTLRNVLTVSSEEFSNSIFFFAQQSAVGLSMVAFLAAPLLIEISNQKRRIKTFACLILFAFIVSSFVDPIHCFIVFGVLLPTLIHVFLFTWIFVVLGAVKTKSKFGFYCSIAMFAMGIVLLCGFGPALPINSTLLLPYYENTVGHVNTWLMRIMGCSQDEFQAGSNSSFWISIARFAAFSYTYHYLNWFSKTTRIQWHLMSWLRWSCIVGTWTLCLTLYALNYSLGLAVMGTLSIAHVYLEFPLNWIASKELCRELSCWIQRIKTPVLKTAGK